MYIHKLITQSTFIKLNTKNIDLADFFPSCLETLVVDAEVRGQIQGHDVACARVRAGR